MISPRSSPNSNARLKGRRLSANRSRRARALLGPVDPKIIGVIAAYTSKSSGDFVLDNGLQAWHHSDTEQAVSLTGRRTSVLSEPSLLSSASLACAVTPQRSPEPPSTSVHDTHHHRCRTYNTNHTSLADLETHINTHNNATPASPPTTTRRPLLPAPMAHPAVHRSPPSLLLLHLPGADPLHDTRFGPELHAVADPRLARRAGRQYTRLDRGHVLAADGVRYVCLDHSFHSKLDHSRSLLRTALRSCRAARLVYESGLRSTQLDHTTLCHAGPPLPSSFLLPSPRPICRHSQSPRTPPKPKAKF